MWITRKVKEVSAAVLDGSADRETYNRFLITISLMRMILHVKSGIGLALTIAFAASFYRDLDTRVTIAILAAAWLIVFTCKLPQTTQEGRAAAALLHFVHGEDRLSREQLKIVVTQSQKGFGAHVLAIIITILVVVTAFVSWIISAGIIEAFARVMFLYVMNLSLRKAVIAQAEAIRKRDQKLPATYLRESFRQLWVPAELVARSGAEEREWFFRLAVRGGAIFAVFFVLLTVIAAASDKATPLMHGYVVVGLVVLVAAAALPVYKRNLQSQSTFSAPRFPRLSWLLSIHVVHAGLLDGVWNLFLMAAFSPFVQGAWWLWVPLVPLAGVTTRFGLVNSTLGLLKLLAQGRFRIVVFRRFSGEAAAPHRAVVLPVVGAFGAVVAINDRSLGATYLGQSAESVLSDWNYLIEEGRADWKERVLFELERSDFVVFHWPNTPTPAMHWEFNAVRVRFPAERILWVTSVDKVAELTAWIEASTGPLSNPLLGLDPARPDRGALRNALLRQVSGLNCEPRPVANPAPETPDNPGDDCA